VEGCKRRRQAAVQPRASLIHNVTAARSQHVGEQLRKRPRHPGLAKRARRLQQTHSPPGPARPRSSICPGGCFPTLDRNRPNSSNFCLRGVSSSWASAIASLQPALALQLSKHRAQDCRRVMQPASAAATVDKEQVQGSGAKVHERVQTHDMQPVMKLSLELGSGAPAACTRRPAEGSTGAKTALRPALA
jgi:hypothetical protein